MIPALDVAELIRRLHSAGVEHVLIGGLAVNAHGAERTTRDVDVLLTAEALDQFRQDCLGADYEEIPRSYAPQIFA